MPTITRKLYPPTIGNRIPAFYQDVESNNIFITIPFQNNRSVSRADIKTFALKLKTITNDYRAINGYAYIEEGEDLDEKVTNAWNEGLVTFKIEPDVYEDMLNIGQFYKIQLAYIATFDPEGEEPTPEECAQYVGYYSEVGITKFSWYPTVYIDGLDETSDNNHTYEYFGRQSQTTQDGEIADSTEKVYKYKFVIGTLEEEVITPIINSGWILHDASNDESEQESYDRWEYVGQLPEEENIVIQYSIETNSGISAESAAQPLVDTTSTEDLGTVELRLDFDNGYVTLITDYDNNDGYWLRTDLETGERVKIGNINPEEAFRDFTVEQGKTYKYQIMVEDKISTEFKTIKVDFEDMFLYDGARQLKVRFNPSMSGLHDTIMENKTDTIGGKYPFFFRNGDVKYKDFSLGGLVSFHMDEQRLFSIYGVEDQPGRDRTYTPMSFTEEPENYDFSLPTDLTGKNFTHERKFREEVLEWLENGEVKLFRSAAEGNMLVRLMGVSMSPDQTTSRMIYSFNCQAYECDDHDYEALVKNKIIKLS